MKVRDILTIGVTAFIVGGSILIEKQEENRKIEKDIEDVKTIKKETEKQFSRKMANHECTIMEKEIRNKKLDHNIEVLMANKASKEN